MNEKKRLYFQYRPELGLPLFVNLEDEQLETALATLFEEMGFEKCSEQSLTKEHSPQELKVLKVSMAGPMVAKQIGLSREEDKYGKESLSQRVGYEVYRYKGVGLMVFHEKNPLWELGLLNLFHKEDYLFQLRVIFHRFLSLSLAQYKIFGVWGATVEEGVVLMSQEEANGEAVFIDIHNSRLFTIEGIKTLPMPFQIIKLDKDLKNTSRTLKIEELASQLTYYNTYFSSSGIPYEVKREILFVSQYAEGTLYPLEKYKPREEAA
jgi:hypothetical protein